ncbi:hypothetical protein QE382_002316 [Sphingobacterium zeae]|uniref:Uncharacterized protein n=1 Tax=Sphingobacterium zeae TaxID=1776859 RepID=A0ABU0U5T5_9SPHI|nr:hypothetical protein [Sphingobacterium zeae]
MEEDPDILLSTLWAGRNLGDIPGLIQHCDAGSCKD